MNQLTTTNQFKLGDNMKVIEDDYSYWQNLVERGYLAFIKDNADLLSNLYVNRIDTAHSDRVQQLGLGRSGIGLKEFTRKLFDEVEYCSEEVWEKQSWFKKTIAKDLIAYAKENNTTDDDLQYDLDCSEHYL